MHAKKSPVTSHSFNRLKGPGIRRVLFVQSALAALFAFSICLAPAVARADERDDEIKQLREMINALDQKLRVLERKQELKDEEAAVAAKAAPKITVNDKGFTVASSDSSTALRLRALVQADSRWYFDDPGVLGREGFILRRARMIFEGQLGKTFQFQIIPEYGGSSVYLLDANINLAFSPAAQVRLGKFKAPVGLEQLQSDSWAFFTERSLVTNLVPNRDIGIQFGGALWSGALEYQLGVFDGVGDGRTNLTNADFDNGKDFIGRVFARPFVSQKESPLAGLGFGIAASVGRQTGDQARTAGYRTDGQQVLFLYRAPVIQDGSTWRVVPQASYYHGPLGVLAEYAISTSNLRPATTQPAIEVTNKAWQIAAGYVLTGENSSFDGVTPAHPFSIENGTWGAFEIVARYDHIDIDNAVFPLLADPAISASSASGWGVGLNWYLSRAFRFSADYIQTDPKSAVPNPTGTVLKYGEKAVLTRAQISF